MYNVYCKIKQRRAQAITTTTKTLKELHAEALKALKSDIFPDGTYNLKTMETETFHKGFQVTFCCVGDDYTAEQYEYLVSLFKELSMDGKVYAGKFGNPEISFRFPTKKLAKKYAKMFNQYSIWNWKKQREIVTGGTGER